MRIQPPPTRQTLEQQIKNDRKEDALNRVWEIWQAHPAPLANGQYLHWDRLKRYPPPGDLNHTEWWYALKMSRGRLYMPTPLTDRNGEPFEYIITDPIPERLHEIDLGAGGAIQVQDQITNDETRDQYIVASLIEEAITSSQLEGASTTRQVAQEMIRSARPPKDKSERMILNNFLTMRQIGELRKHALSKDLILDLHRRVTQGTMADDAESGRFRTKQEPIVVEDAWGNICHNPPPAEQLEERLEAMCRFANGDTPEGFVHPAIRSIILHFWLAYDHPFVDGNGRTARALFYWSMLHHGYWLIEFISISRVILRARADYERAYLYTETDDNDLTYFILYHLDVIQKAIENLHSFIDKRRKEIQVVDLALRDAGILNHRQRAIISHALRHPRFRYTIEGHRVSHNVVYQTARTDLLELNKLGLMTARKIGRTWYFTPREDLEGALSRV